MLKPRGVLRMVVPSLKSRVEHYIKTRDTNLFMKSLGCVIHGQNDNLLKKIRFLENNELKATSFHCIK